jgi:hypothetical protein
MTTETELGLQPALTKTKDVEREELHIKRNGYVLVLLSALFTRLSEGIHGRS